MRRPLAILGAALLLPASGCGLEPGSGLCTETQIAVRDVKVSDPYERLALPARLTAGDRPLAGQDLSYFVKTVDRSGARSGSTIGPATTDADGAAERVVKGGSAGLSVLSDRTVIGYSVYFVSLTKIDGVQYCRSWGEAKLTVPCAGLACD